MVLVKIYKKEDTFLMICDCTDTGSGKVCSE